MAHNGRLINQETTWEINLTVLQRVDHNIEDILITAGHVTLYEFDVDKCQWSRKDVEGSLFVVKRRMKPRFQFIIMNRRSTENLVEDLLDKFEYELQMPYLLYRNASQEVNGIWFYNSRECEEVAKLFSRILGAYSKNTPKRKVFTPQVDEFQELEAIPSSATVRGPLGTPSAPLTPGGAENPLEQLSSNALHLNACDPVSPTMGMRTIAPIHSSPVHPTVEKAFSQVLAMSPPSLQASSPPLSPPLPPLSSSKHLAGRD